MSSSQSTSSTPAPAPRITTTTTTTAAAAASFMPHAFASHPLTGQLFMIAPNHNQPLSYFVPRFMDPNTGAASAISLPHQLQTSAITMAPHQFAPQFHALPPPPAPMQQATFNHHQIIQTQQHQTTTQRIQQQSEQIPNSPVQIQKKPESKSKPRAPSASPRTPKPRRDRAVETDHQPVKLKDQTNAVLKGLKDRCLSHYIEGQLIIETHKPFSELKPKNLKKKDKKRPIAKQSRETVNKNDSTQSLASQNDSQAPQHSDQGDSIVELNSHIDSPVSKPATIESPAQSIEISEVVEPVRGKDDAPDIQAIRKQMPSWTVSDVVKFIEQHEDIKQYSSKFADDEIDGMALQLMIDRNLNLQMLASMFKHGPAMKIEAVLSRYKATE